ncbi:stage II sporulation protein M [Trueperella sp. LYQ143]|uniref:stage II sporulation protein M n=1 Tax=unclassified Trueperella TaxID=2630174 RepID=UPI003983CBE1
MESLAYAKAHEGQWLRLQQLTRKRRLNGLESDEFVSLYQACATHLAKIRTSAPDADMILTLSAITAAARAKLTDHSRNRSNTFRYALTRTYPYAIYRLRWWILALVLATLTVVAVVLINMRVNPAAIAELNESGNLRQYAYNDFEEYYSHYASQDFGLQVWTNNAALCAVALAGSLTGVIPLWMFLINSLNIAHAAAVMAYYGQADVFIFHIAVHGWLELSVLFVVLAASFRLFWKLISPGHLPRVRALAAEGPHLLRLVVAMVVLLAISAVIEAYITPLTAPWAAKIAVGALVGITFWVWVFVFGRRPVVVEEPVAYVG